MSPPTEQLIRDYLNRLSVAARGQLGPDDRRALVTRMHEFIERKTGLTGPPTTIEVGRLLAGLGDPAALVEQELQRLAALRGDSATPASTRNGWVGRLARRETGKVRHPSWHWPVQLGSRFDLQQTLLEGDESAPEASPAAAEDGSSAEAYLADSGPRLAGEAGLAGAEDAGADDAGADDAGPTVHVPAPRREREWLFAGFGSARRPPPPGTRHPAGSADVADPSGQTTSHDGQPPQTDDATEPQQADDDAAKPERSWRLAVRQSESVQAISRATFPVRAWARQHPMESLAVVLLGLGGAIYPPVWLLGAAVALTSGLWDYLDKWIGLAAPIVVTVIGIAAGLAHGGDQVSLGYDVHEGWIFADVVSRIAAALGAAYLAWRSARGKRNAVPPWNRPHKIS